MCGVATHAVGRAYRLRLLHLNRQVLNRRWGCSVATHAVGGLCGDSGYFLFVSMCFVKVYRKRPSEINGSDGLACMDCLPQTTRACLGAHTLRLKSARVESAVGCVA